MEEKYIAAIDLGTSKIALTVAKAMGDDIQIIYYKETPSDGIRNSYVFNPMKAAGPLRQAIDQAEQELRIKIGRLSARKKTIEEMESNYEGYNYAVKHVMKSGLSGIHGVVADLIRVPKGYEVAMETALGASLQNIVCDDDDSAKRAIRSLKENKAGRMTFLPLRSIKAGVSGNENFRSESGFKGFGPECVEYDSNDKVVKPAFWNLPSYFDDLRDCFLIGRLGRNNDSNMIDPNVFIQTVPVIKGSFLAVNAKEFFEVKGFDENVFLYCEERILARKMADKGYRLGIVTGAKFHHNHSASIEKAYSSAAKRVKILYQSRMYYNKEYNHIGLFRRAVLRIAMMYSLLEYLVIGVVKQIKSRTFVC